jgi:hypothetical protein
LLTGSGFWPPQPVLILVAAYSVANIAAGIGLLRLAGWARLLAGALSSFALVTMYAPTLLAAVADGAWSRIDWLGLAFNVVVLFVVLRRWPAGRAHETRRLA